MKFDWDESKNKSNRHKHGVWFEEAQSCFDDPNGRLFLNPESKEERFLLVAFSSSSRLLIVVHCYRESESLVRIISARRATKMERKQYEERV